MLMNWSLDAEGSLEMGDQNPVAIFFVSIALWIFATFHEMERKHLRSERLAALKRRRCWKKSDVRYLETLGLRAAALKRMQRLTGRGRPVVTPHRPLSVFLDDKLSFLGHLFGPNSTAVQRRQGLKHAPWFPHIVESLYRAEHEISRRQHIQQPSADAEMRVGRELGISPATVHSLCVRVRQERRRSNVAADFPLLTLIEYETWMRTGECQLLELSTDTSK
jgi:hypothetical protein